MAVVTNMENGADRAGLILDASLEVFSEFSFQDATTSEIARRARISKRDLYAVFSSKEVLLRETVLRELVRQQERFQEVIGATARLANLKGKLERIGSAIVVETLSNSYTLVKRLVVSESMKQPILGTLYYERGLVEKTHLLAELLTAHKQSGVALKRGETERAAGRYLSMIAYLPSSMVEIGIAESWTPERIKLHVSMETQVFLAAHPVYS